MTSKERVRCALARERVDRVARTFGAVNVICEKLKRHFQVETMDAVLDLLGVDTRSMDLPAIKKEFIRPPVINAKGKTEEWGFCWNRAVNQWNGIEYNSIVCHYPLEPIESFDDLEKLGHLFPNPDEYDYSSITAFTDRYPDKALQIGWPGPYQVFTLLYPVEKTFVMMAEEPELAKAMFDKYFDACLEIYRRMLEAGKGKIDILRCCDDYGCQRGLLFSPKMWDEFFAENTKKLTTLVHSYDCFYLQHSCGAIDKIIPKLVDCGIDALEPLQKLPGMEPESLKARFGDKICFQGGVDTQWLLPFGTPEEVRDETKRIIDMLSPGYILAPSQSFEGDVPIENILALYSAGE